MIAFLYWLSALALTYSLAGYGVIVTLLARLRAPRPPPPSGAPPSVSFLIAAFNEGDVIADKIRNTLDLDSGGASVEVIVASDGSSDDTVAQARAAAGDDPHMRILDLPRGGKAKALAEGMALCTGEVLVLSDANAMLTPGTLTAMLRYYADPTVGGVCGQITVESKGGIGGAEGLFWRYDQALKQAESRLGGAVSAQGSVYSLRRSPGSAARARLH